VSYSDEIENMQVLRLDFADFDTIPNRADLDKTLFYYIGIKRV